MSTVPRIKAGTLKEAFALQPELFDAFWDLYGTMWMDGQVDHTTKEIARLRNANVTDCGYCKRVRFSVAHDEGVDEEAAEQVAGDYESSSLTLRHKLALRLTDQFLHNPEPPPEDLELELAAEFTEGEYLELGVALAMFMGFAKMLITLGLEPDQEMPITIVATPGLDRRATANPSGRP